MRMPGASDRVKRMIPVCRYCRGFCRHTCTGITCDNAVRDAVEAYRKEKDYIRMKRYEESSDRKHYGKTVMEALHAVLEVGLDEDINSIRRIYGLDEILDAVLVYEGILGYSEKLIHIIKDIFGVDLLEIDA